MAKKPWKKNFLDVPEHIREEIASFESYSCVVACPVAIKASDIKVGLFAHLGIIWEGNEPTYPEKKLPDPEIGRYSKYNRFGREIVHKELPKVQKSWSIDTPNWGDWSKGTHEIVFSKEVYQRTFIPPKFLPILIESLGHDVTQEAYIFKFTVDEVLDRRDPDFLRIFSLI
jgi:hypothetical protein